MQLYVFASTLALPQPYPHDLPEEPSISPSPCLLSPRPSVQRPCPPSPRAVLAFPGPSFCSETVRSLCDSKHKTTQRLTPWLPRESCTKGRGGLFFHAASCAAQRSDAAPARTSHLHTYKTRSRQTTALGTQRRRSAQPGKTTALLRLLFLRRKGPRPSSRPGLRHQKQ